MTDRPTMARFAAAAAALALGLVAACGGDDSAGTTTTTTSTSSTSSSTTASTEAATTSESTTPTTEAAPTAFRDSAAGAVQELKEAWQGGDRNRALAIAPVGVVDELFALDPGGYETYGCDTGEFETSTCNYRSRSQGIQIAVTARRTEPGWQIESIHVSQG
ncbi:MAG: hypothetical protein GXY13_15020 [Acidimicrobiales bacterium]|nr:hypothetical protein [Acidimicrobiales bacterium]